jgi:hypothetical protein
VHALVGMFDSRSRLLVPLSCFSIFVLYIRFSSISLQSTRISRVVPIYDLET